MPRKVPPLDRDDLIRRYVAGESCGKIAATVGVSESWVAKLVRDAGVLRTSRETKALRPTERPETTARIDEALNLRESGLTQREIGERFGVSQATVSTWLLSRGHRADLSAAMTKRLASMTSAERAAITAAAHDAVRGVKRPHSELVSRAVTKQKLESHATDEERAIAALLAQAGLTPVLQEAVDKYNLDIGVAPVAVELFGGGWHAHGRHAARMPQRIEDIADRGFNLLIIWTHHVHPLDVRAVADDALAYYEIASRDPSFRRQYRVIWGDGKFIASGSVDDDKLTLIPAGIRGTYAARR